jgi:hypothetical protein
MLIAIYNAEHSRGMITIAQSCVYILSICICISMSSRVVCVDIYHSISRLCKGGILNFKLKLRL